MGKYIEEIISIIFYGMDIKDSGVCESDSVIGVKAGNCVISLLVLSFFNSSVLIPSFFSYSVT